MTIHECDGARLLFLVRRSFEPSQLREFFLSKQPALLLAHEKVQHLPTDMSVAIQRFSPQAHAVFRSWLATQSVADPVPDSQLVPRFRAVEELGVVFTDDESIHLARSALHALYRETPPEELLEFLRSPIPTEVGKRRSNGVEITANIAQESWEAVLDATSGDSSPRQIGDSTLQVAIALVLAAVRGSDAGLESVSPPAQAAYRAYRAKRGTATGSAKVLSGVMSSPLEVRHFDPDLDYGAMEVVAIRTRPTLKKDVPWFADAEALVVGNDIYSLSRNDWAKALPDTGQVVIHRSRGISEPPLNEPRVYQIELIDTTFPSKALATKALDRLLPVVFMPCASTEAHSIRDFIGDYAKYALHGSAIFVTTDNLCLRPRKVSLSRINYPENDWMMECWQHLRAHELSAGTFALEPLPAYSQLLDCGPLSVVAKRILGNLRSRTELSLSKAAIAAFADYLAGESSGLSELTKTRLMSNLQSIESSGDDYQQLVSALLEVPQIANDIAERKKQAVDEQRDALHSEKQRIDNLRRQAKELQAANRKLEEKHESIVKELRAAIRKAFASATKKEVAALGEMSLLAALLESTQTPIDSSPNPPNVVAQERSLSPRLVAKVLDKKSTSINETLSSFGIDAGLTEVIADILAVVVRSGVFVILEEPGACTIGAELAAALTRNTVRSFDVPIGLIEPSIRSEWLDPSDCDVLLFNNANHSDLTVYAPDLLSMVTRRLIGKGDGPFPAVFLTGSTGAAGVPWPSDMESLSINLSLASLENLVTMTEEPDERPVSMTPMRRLLERAVEHQEDALESTKDVRRAVKHLLHREG